MNQNEKALADCRKAFEEKFKDRVRLLRCFKMNGNEVLDELEDRYTRADANLAWDAFQDAWFSALESKPVAGQVSGEEVEADLKNILNVLDLNFDGPNRNENLRRLRKYAERALAVFRTSQEPQAPAVEVPSDDHNELAVSFAHESIEALLDRFKTDPEVCAELTLIKEALLTSRQGGQS